MKRKTFLKRFLKLGFITGTLNLFQSSLSFSQTNDSPTDQEKKFKDAWVTSLMTNMEKQLDKKSRIRVMESCGRDCAKRGAIQIAQSNNGSVKKFTKILGEIPDLEIEKKSPNSYSVIYRKCFCTLVSRSPKRLPETYCECSKGWLLQMFETATKKAVDVKINQTIKRGSQFCHFTVSLT